MKKVPPNNQQMVTLISCQTLIMVIRDPKSKCVQGYFASRAIYIDGQNLKINLTKFQDTVTQVKNKLFEEQRKTVN